MKKAFKNIFNLALSGIDIQKKVKRLSSYWNEHDEIKLFNLAVKDEVASHIAFILKSSNLNYQNFWIEEYDKINDRIDVLMSELDILAKKFDDVGISVVALKNAGINRGIYKNNGCSPMGDIDLLVSSLDFNRAHKIILNKLGYTFEFRSELEEANLEKAFRHGGTEYFKNKNGYKIWFELQWRPIAGRWIQPHNEPNGDDLLKRSIEIENSKVRILSPVDNLLQVSLHTAKHSYVRAPGFRLHSDVDRIIRFQEINWKNFSGLVHQKKIKTAVYYSLFFSKKLLETPIPSEYLEKLKPNFLKDYIIKKIIYKAGIYNQEEKKFLKSTYILFNILLYDSSYEVFKAVFPNYKSMAIQYDIKSRLLLPFFYIKRIQDLLFKRASL